ncbi:MAG: winged helix-turn-helix domain-containing protein, partial [Pyrinomonadaceae bacterium]
MRADDLCYNRGIVISVSGTMPPCNYRHRAILRCGGGESPKVFANCFLIFSEEAHLLRKTWAKPKKQAMKRQIYTFDIFQLDAGNRQLRRDDKPLPLPAKAFDLLLTLVKNNGRLVEKDELFTSVWQDQIVEESNLTVYISQIRK